jgi:hypothetical protein
MNIDVLFYRTKIKKYQTHLPERIDNIKQKSKEIIDYIHASKDERLSDFKRNNPHIFTTKETNPISTPATKSTSTDVIPCNNPQESTSSSTGTPQEKLNEPGPELELPKDTDIHPRFRSLYRAACINLHPDKCGDNETNNKRFSRIQSAFQGGDIYTILDIMLEAGIDVSPFIDKTIKQELKTMYTQLHNKAKEFKSNPTGQWRPDMTDEEKIEYITTRKLVFFL